MIKEDFRKLGYFATFTHAKTEIAYYYKRLVNKPGEKFT